MQHPRLKRLLEKWQQEGRSWPEGMTDLCEEISRNFYEFDREKMIMEQSIAASQEDYAYANQRLLQLNQDLERQVALRTKEKDMLADFPLENPNPVFRINTNGHIVYQNPPSLSMRVVEYQSKAYLIADFLEAFPTLLKTAAGNMEVKSEGRIFSITYKKLLDDDINLYCLDVTDQKHLQERAYDNFYRLNNFLESTDAVYYIIYKNHPEKSFFTSRWPLFFGFNPTKTSQPLQERQKSILPASLDAYQEAMRQLDFSGQATFKYQIENAVTHKQLWLEEEVKKKFDPFLNDEVLTGRITDVSGAEFYREYILESEKRFKRVTDSLPVMVWVSDQNDLVTYSNDKTKEFFGFALEDMKGQEDFVPLVHPDYRKLAIEEWGQKVKRREPIDGVFSIKGQDGEYHYIHEIAVPRFLESGQFVGYIGAYFDLTKEYQYQKELEADKQQFELIAQNSSDVTVITDWKGKISYISPGVSRLLGYTPEEIKGTSLYELYCEECWKMLKPRFAKKELQGTGIKTFTFRLVKKDKGLLWVDTAVRTIDSPTDKNQNLLFHIRDVHEQKMAHQALESSEEKYRTLFENMDLGVLEVDQEEQIIYANNAMERITGYTISEMKGQVASRLFINSEEDKKILSEQERGRKKGKESIYELNMTRKSGEIARLVISGAPVFDVNGKVRGSVGIHWDVTRIRSMEQQLLEERINQEKYILEAKLQAEEDQRSQIGRDLHDGVGQMLAYMSLFLNMIKSKAVYDPVDIAQLEKTVKQTLEQVRTLSRTLAPPAIRDLGLRDSVVELVDSYGILTKPVFKLKVYPQAEDARITLDKKIVIFRVLQELLNNTFKYADADTISIHLYFKGTDLHMDYVDDGKGFDITKIQKGVGLDSMRSRIGFYKGLIEIRSAPGKGTKTFIQLPSE
jgi:PAS domain S-box-containing protein